MGHNAPQPSQNQSDAGSIGPNPAQFRHVVANLPLTT